MAKIRRQRFVLVGSEDVPANEAADEAGENPGDKACSIGEKDGVADSDGGYTTGLTRTSNDVLRERKPLDLSKIRDTRRVPKGRGGRNAKLRAENQAAAARRAPDDAVTFAPSAATRVEMMDVLSARRPNKDRNQLERKLEREFIRVYMRHRHKLDPNARVMPSEHKYARAAAVACIFKSITPTQLIEYWVDNIGNFTGMNFPPLSFLSGPGNVDRAAVEVSFSRPKRRKRKRRGRRTESPEVHAYSGELDSRLRPGLEAAGFDLSRFSDRFLLSVQTTAVSRAAGKDMFVSSKMKPMVQWAVDNLYAD